MYALDLEQGNAWTRATAETILGGFRVYAREAREQTRRPMSSNERLSLACLIDFLEHAIDELERAL